MTFKLKISSTSKLLINNSGYLVIAPGEEIIAARLYGTALLSKHFGSISLASKCYKKTIEVQKHFKTTSEIKK